MKNLHELLGFLHGTYGRCILTVYCIIYTNMVLSVFPLPFGFYSMLCCCMVPKAAGSKCVLLSHSVPSFQAPGDAPVSFLVCPAIWNQPWVSSIAFNKNGIGDQDLGFECACCYCGRWVPL